MYRYKLPENALPVMPGAKLYGIDTEDYIICEETAAGVAVFEDHLCAILNGGDIVDLNGPYFLSREEAEDWIRKNRRPTLEELLEAAIWHEGNPEKDGRCFIRLEDGSVRSAFFLRDTEADEYEDMTGFYKSSNGLQTYPPYKGVIAWTEYPEVEVVPFG